MQPSQQKALFALLLTFLALFLRLYTISLDLPYFYHEDEAHHFNRTVNMAKQQDFNPRYFHKPSLHFYFRMPVVWASAWWAKRNGELSSLNEVRTYNRFGLANYAFTASHPTTVEWNRSLSVAFGVLLVIVIFCTTYRLTASLSAAVASGLLCAVSPDLITHSGIIGVDMLMSLLCWISVAFGLRYLDTKRERDFIIAAIAAGLAVSSKYNALPIVAVPGIIALTSRPFSWRLLLFSISIPVISFFAGSPYILVETESFIKDLSYEIWHYNVAGHVGHMANPGMEQVLFYWQWIYEHAAGSIAAVAALIGLIVLLLSLNRRVLVVIIFPLLYFLEMALQKANFTRNMLVFIPFIGIASSFLLLKLLALSTDKAIVKRIAWCLFIAALSIEPLAIALSERSDRTAHRDTREAVAAWVLAHHDESIATALSGSLLLPRSLTELSNTTTIDERRAEPIDFFMDGYDRMVVGSGISSVDYRSLPFLKEQLHVPGTPEKQRIMIDPEIYIYDFGSWDEILRLVDRTPLSGADDILSFHREERGHYECHAGTELYCWTTKRVSTIILNDTPTTEPALETKNLILHAEVMSPWPGQELYLLQKNGETRKILDNPLPGTWTTISIEAFPAELGTPHSLRLFTKIIDSPAHRKMNSDSRRLGVAIKSIEIQE